MTTQAPRASSGVEFGLDTFGDIPVDDAGDLLPHADAIRRVVEEAVLADRVGVDVIALGEHHRPDYAISTPETVLAGIATRTERITLASGVTVLSSDDPVRVSSASPPSTRSQGAGRRSSSAAAPSPSPSRCSATTWPTTTCSSRRRSSSSPGC
ncbi:hypothetical protein GCM10027300_03410 [Modestobacter lapidis]